MKHEPLKPFNPCRLGESEQLPAKIWELLRRNARFRENVDKLVKLDAKEQTYRLRNGNYHGVAWEKSMLLLEQVSDRHPFAGVALQWLVPEPLFQCSIVTRSRPLKRRKGESNVIRLLKDGEGTTPDVTDKSWNWRTPEQPDIAGRLETRGPFVQWTRSRCKGLGDLVNPIDEWQKYDWPFTVEHDWSKAPEGFKRAFQFIWRSRFDSRPNNQLTNNRLDSPFPHEVSVFRDWCRSEPQSEEEARKEVIQAFRFQKLATEYRVFAIPRTILTKGSATKMGIWLADELKRGSDLHGELLQKGLLDEAEFLGRDTEWNDWLAHKSKHPTGESRSTQSYRRCRYMESLVSQVFPRFDLSKLLAAPSHRARGKKYVPKSRNE